MTLFSGLGVSSDMAAPSCCVAFSHLQFSQIRGRQPYLIVRKILYVIGKAPGHTARTAGNRNTRSLALWWTSKDWPRKVVLRQNTEYRVHADDVAESDRRPNPSTPKSDRSTTRPQLDQASA